MNDYLHELLIKYYGKDIEINGSNFTTFRINRLKSNYENIKSELDRAGIDFYPIENMDNAYFTKENLLGTDIYKSGCIYLQNPSAMIPAYVLDPKEKENILDMTASPGGKTSQMYDLSQGKAYITALERDKIRYETLKHNLNLQGVRCNVMLCDATKIDSNLKFDKVLLDAPCSGSGTGNRHIEKDWLDRVVLRQKRLLSRAVDVTKVGGVIVYSTCSILPCENEEVVRTILKRCRVESIENIWGVKTLPNNLAGTLTISPDELHQGFYVAKLIRVK